MRGGLRARAGLLLFLCLSACGIRHAAIDEATPESAGMDGAALARIDRVIGREIDRGNIPGATVEIVHHGAIVYRKAFGARALYPKRETNTIDTLYDLASMTKPIGTATAIMKLVERGDVRLWDRVAHYDPAFAQHGKAQVTIEELLDHSAGLPSALNERQSIMSEAEGEMIVDRMPLHFAPGSRYEYCNTCFIELAKIVRLVSGHSLADFDASQLFGPLGLGETLLFDPSKEQLALVSPEADDAHGRYPRGQFLIGGFGPIGARGHAGLFGTADAVAAYGQMLLNGGELRGVRVLSQASVATMIAPRYLGRENQRGADVRGLGWDEATTDSSNRGELFAPGGFGHTGSTGCALWIDPATQTVVVLLTNSAHLARADDDAVVRLYAKISTIAASAVTDPGAAERSEQQAAEWSARVAAQAPGFERWAAYDERLWQRTHEGTPY